MERYKTADEEALYNLAWFVSNYRIAVPTKGERRVSWSIGPTAHEHNGDVDHYLYGGLGEE